MSTLHVVEVGGEGGVYQHVLGAAEHGTYRQWKRVVLHTSKDAEVYPEIAGLEFHRCMRWQRRGPRFVRRIATVAWALGVLLPHLAWESLTSRADWEVQGQFGRGFYVFFVLVPRLVRRRVTFSPHNSFLRHGGIWEAPILRAATALATKTIVYVRSESSRFPSAKAIEQRALWQYAPSPDAELDEKWLRKLKSGRPLVLFTGQLRNDKNPLLLIEAVNLLEISVNLVFAGQDKGAARAIRMAPLDSRHDRFVEDRFLDLNEMVTLIDLCDVVVCPYQIASQSGIVALANQLGSPVVVSSAGGLGEQSTLTFDLGEEQSENLALVLREVLAKGGFPMDTGVAGHARGTNVA